MMHQAALTNGPALLLRIFIGESDRWRQMELYEALLLEARQFGLAGGTVLKGVLGYGANRHFHAAKLVDLSADLPVIVEIADREESIRAFLQHIAPMLSACGCLVTLQHIEVYQYHALNENSPTQ